MEIRQQGNFIFINLQVQGKVPAKLLSSGRIVPESSGMIEIDKKPDSWTRQRDPGVKFGTELTVGEATVSLDIRDLYSLAMRATRNRNKKAKQGVARAAFSGLRTFEPEA